jgi:hypothetical protein
LLSISSKGIIIEREQVGLGEENSELIEAGELVAKGPRATSSGYRVARLPSECSVWFNPEPSLCLVTGQGVAHSQNCVPKDVLLNSLGTCPTRSVTASTTLCFVETSLN